MGKIYTKTGDKGTTALFGGTRVPKNHLRVETYGTVDELNSAIGAAIAFLKPQTLRLKGDLEIIQSDLLDIGSALATPQANPLVFLEGRVQTLEKLIDVMTGRLPSLTNFILPGGSKAGSLLHVARTVCRRAEREFVALSQKETVGEEIGKYFNRLSDVLFTMARFVNMLEEKKETKWSATKK